MSAIDQRGGALVTGGGRLTLDFTATNSQQRDAKPTGGG
jgi:hypothetical protein